MLKAWREISDRPDVLKVLKSIERETSLPMVRHTVSELVDYSDWLSVYQSTLSQNDLNSFLEKLNSVERDAVAVLMGRDQQAKARTKRLIRSRLMRTTRAIEKAVAQVESEQ